MLTCKPEELIVQEDSLLQGRMLAHIHRQRGQQLAGHSITLTHEELIFTRLYLLQGRELALAANCSPWYNTCNAVSWPMLSGIVGKFVFARCGSTLAKP